MIVFLKKYNTTTFNNLHYNSLGKNFTDRFTYENRPLVNLSSVKKKNTDGFTNRKYTLKKLPPLIYR
jgi:hypothetical protein